MSTPSSVSNSRICKRLVPVTTDTKEYYSSANGALDIEISLFGKDCEAVQALIDAMPTTGMDRVTVTYGYGPDNSSSVVKYITLWGTDGGWCYIGTDDVQYLISSADGSFFDDYALLINARNTNLSASPLLLCENGDFGFVETYQNYTYPTVWIRQGIQMTNTDETVTAPTYVSWSSSSSSASGS